MDVWSIDGADADAAVEELTANKKFRPNSAAADKGAAMVDEDSSDEKEIAAEDLRSGRSADSLTTDLPQPPIASAATNQMDSKHSTAPAAATATGVVDLFSSVNVIGRDSTPLSDGLVTLSSLPKSRWVTLPLLDAIKQRNKPKAAPVAPVRAPFFMSFIGLGQKSELGVAPGSTEPAIDKTQALAVISDHKQTEQAKAAAERAATLGSSRILQSKGIRSHTPLLKQLQLARNAALATAIDSSPSAAAAAAATTLSKPDTSATDLVPASYDRK